MPQPKVAIVEKSIPANLHIKTNARRDEAQRSGEGFITVANEVGSAAGGAGTERTRIDIKTIHGISSVRIPARFIQQ
jgi:hypothetical protein